MIIFGKTYRATSKLNIEVLPNYFSKKKSFYANSVKRFSKID